MPVYVINALYLWPITLWTYLNYGRPPKAKEGQNAPSHCMTHSPNAQRDGESVKEQFDTQGMADLDIAQPSNAAYQQGHSPAPHHPEAAASYSGGDDHHHNHGGGDRPMFATITVAVCHCGAGCVLGDIIGEWIVYGANVTIRGRSLWAEYLIGTQSLGCTIDHEILTRPVLDFLFAIVIGIFFQYFSIAPMSGEYGLKSFYRAAKADFLSLLFFEIGLFGWMAIFQVAIFQWKLEMTTVTYWWMMQVSHFEADTTAPNITLLSAQ